MTSQHQLSTTRIKVLRVALVFAALSYLSAWGRDHAHGIEGEFNAIAYPLGTLVMLVTLAWAILSPQSDRIPAIAAISFQATYLLLQYYFSLFVFPGIVDVRSHMFPLAAWQPLMAVFCVVSLQRREALIAAAALLLPGAVLVIAYCVTTPQPIAPLDTKGMLIDAFVIAPATALVLMLSVFAAQQHLAEAQDAVDRSERLALSDELTQLPNRRAIKAVLERELARIRRNGGLLGLALMDIDDFKNINDFHGHAYGDEVLRATAERLSRTLRGSDYGGRWGGDEFMIALVDTDLAGLGVAGQRIHTACCGPMAPDGPPIRVSIGLAVAQPGDDVADLIKRADDALYEAKKGGRDRVVLAPHPNAQESQGPAAKGVARATEAELIDLGA
jgi:diguanylate cyclase (GGDEF)-like protein